MNKSVVIRHVDAEDVTQFDALTVLSLMNQFQPQTEWLSF